MDAEIKTIDGGFCNSYLIGINGENILVDYGRHDKMQKALNGADISRVLLTHAHRENCADLWLFDREIVAFGDEYGILSDI
jgi:glyoxylase-like metal-dependent hydrolase (beta-lactamase superfamily II)